MDELAEHCPCVTHLQMAGRGPEVWLPRVVFQGQKGRESRQKRASFSSPFCERDEPLDEKLKYMRCSKVFAPGHRQKSL